MKGSINICKSTVASVNIVSVLRLLFASEVRQISVSIFVLIVYLH